MQKKRFSRKFDTWTWKSDTGKEYSFEVRYEKGETAHEPVRFYIEHERPPVFVEDGNLETLRQKLDIAVKALVNATWEQYLVVLVNDYDRGNVMGTVLRGGVEFHVNTILVGTNPAGDKFWKPDERTKYCYVGDPADSEQHGVGWTTGGGIRTIIKDTPQNRAVLERLQNFMNNLANYIKVACLPEKFDNLGETVTSYLPPQIFHMFNNKPADLLGKQLFYYQEDDK